MYFDVVYGVLQKRVVKFNDKCIAVDLSSDAVALRGGLELEIRQRIVTVRRGLKSEVYSVRGGRKKVVYVHHPGVGAECYDAKNVEEEFLSSLAHIKYTKCRLGGYLTIIMSGQFLVDYIVIDDNLVAIVLPGRREIYVERAGDTVALYVV